MSYVLRPQQGAGTVYERDSAWQSAAFMAACCSVFAALGLVLVALTSGGTSGPSVFLQVSLNPQTFVAAQPALASADSATAVEQPAAAVAAAPTDTAAPDTEATAPAAAEVDESASVAAAGSESSSTGVSSGATSKLAGRTVWSDGDSTSYFMSLWLLGALEDLGAVPVHDAEYYQSSGLTTPEFFDWPTYIDQQMALYNPEIVVFMVGTNDIDPRLNLDDYAALVGQQMDALQGREVYWIGVPSFDPDLRPDLATMAPTINDLFISEAAKRPWVTYVDVMGVTTDENGNYAADLPGVSGEVMNLRTVDGIHFTSEGGHVMAAQILAAIQSH